MGVDPLAALALGFAVVWLPAAFGMPDAPHPLLPAASGFVQLGSSSRGAGPMPRM